MEALSSLLDDEKHDESDVLAFMEGLQSVSAAFRVVAPGIDRQYKSEEGRENRKDLADNLHRTTEQRI